jgi:hypothetical protein
MVDFLTVVVSVFLFLYLHRDVLSAGIRCWCFICISYHIIREEFFYCNPVVTVDTSDLELEMRAFCAARRLPYQAWARVFELLRLFRVEDVALLPPALVDV